MSFGLKLINKKDYFIQILNTKYYNEILCRCKLIYTGEISQLKGRYNELECDIKVKDKTTRKKY